MCCRGDYNLVMFHSFSVNWRPLKATKIQLNMKVQEKIIIKRNIKDHVDYFHFFFFFFSWQFHFD